MRRDELLRVVLLARPFVDFLLRLDEFLRLEDCLLPLDAFFRLEDCLPPLDVLLRLED